jgi:hypothetical protein
MHGKHKSDKAVPTPERQKPPISDIGAKPRFVERCRELGAQRAQRIVYESPSHKELARRLHDLLISRFGALPNLPVVIVTDTKDFLEKLGIESPFGISSEGVCFQVGGRNGFRMLLLRAKLIQRLAKGETDANATLLHEMEHVRQIDHHMKLAGQIQHWPPELLHLTLNSLQEYEAERATLGLSGRKLAKRCCRAVKCAHTSNDDYFRGLPSSRERAFYANALAAAYPEFVPPEPFAAFVRELRKLDRTPENEAGLVSLAWETCKVAGFNIYHLNKVRLGFPGFHPEHHPTGKAVPRLPKLYTPITQRRTFYFRSNQIARLAVVGGTRDQRLKAATFIRSWLSKQGEHVRLSEVPTFKAATQPGDVRKAIARVLLAEARKLRCETPTSASLTTLVSLGGVLDLKSSCPPEVWEGAIRGVWNEEAFLKFHYDAVFQVVTGEIPKDAWSQHPCRCNVLFVRDQLYQAPIPLLEKFLKFRRYPYLDPDLPVNQGEKTPLI